MTQTQIHKYLLLKLNYSKKRKKPNLSFFPLPLSLLPSPLSHLRSSLHLPPHRRRKPSPVAKSALQKCTNSITEDTIIRTSIVRFRLERKPVATTGPPRMRKKPPPRMRKEATLHHHESLHRHESLCYHESLYR